MCVCVSVGTTKSIPSPVLDAHPIPNLASSQKPMGGKHQREPSSVMQQDSSETSGMQPKGKGDRGLVGKTNKPRCPRISFKWCRHLFTAAPLTPANGPLQKITRL